MLVNIISLSQVRTCAKEHAGDKVGLLLFERTKPDDHAPGGAL